MASRKRIPSTFSEKSYEGAATTYDAARFTTSAQRFVHERDLAILKELLQEAPPGDTVEVACGTGRLTIELARDGRRVTGVEIAADMLRKAVEKSENMSQTGINWVQANASALPFVNGAFSALYTVRFLNLFPARELGPLCAELERVVQPGGVLIVHFSNPFYGAGAAALTHRLTRRYHKHFLWPMQIRKLFPRCDVRGNRGTYLPLQSLVVRSCSDSLTAKMSAVVSRSSLRHFTHTKFYYLRRC